MDISERLKLIRGDLRQQDFANKVGVKKNTVGRWERGEQNPTQAELCVVLEAFPEISPTWLLTGDGPMKGFVAGEPAQVQGEAEVQGGKGPVDISDDLLEAINKILEEKLGDRKAEITASKLMTLTMTLVRFYSRNFIESEEFRQDTLEKNVESLVKLALPDNK